MFYGFALISSSTLGVLPPILGSLDVRKARDGARPITLVRPRLDIIANHLGGSTYYSNVPELEADLRAMQARSAAPGELALLEVRYVENGRLPLGIFEPVSGWPLRDVIGFLRGEPPLAAAIALQIYRSYSGAPNVVTPDGRLVREMLPHFDLIWDSEVPSFIGTEPDISILGRIAEARTILATVGSLSTRGERDANTVTAGALFEDELTELAGGLSLGPALARRLADYSFRSPW